MIISFNESWKLATQSEKYRQYLTPVRLDVLFVTTQTLTDKKKKKTFSSHHFLQDNTHCTSHHWLYETFCCVGVQLSSFFFHVWLPRQQITIWLPCEVRDKYEARLTAQTCPGEQGDRRETCSDPV